MSSRLRAAVNAIACAWAGHRWVQDWIWQRRCKRCQRLDLRDLVRGGWIRAK